MLTGLRGEARGLAAADCPPMSALRLSAVFLAVAAVAGGAGMGLPDAWDGLPRALCLGALVAFVVTFLIGLDKSALVRR